MATLSSKIKNTLEQLNDIEIEEKVLQRQLQALQTKKEKLQQKLQELLDKTIPIKKRRIPQPQHHPTLEELGIAVKQEQRNSSGDE